MRWNENNQRLYYKNDLSSEWNLQQIPLTCKSQIIHVTPDRSFKGIVTKWTNQRKYIINFD